MELGFVTSYQVIQIPGRSDLFQVRTINTPRLGGERLTSSQAAEQLGLSRSTVLRLINSGAIKAYQPGILRHVILQRDLDAYKRSRGMD